MGEPIFFTEYKTYSLRYLEELLDSATVEHLKSNGVLRRGKNDSGQFYQFTFVGVASTKDVVLAILPKIYDEKTANAYTCISKVIRVLKRYSKDPWRDSEDASNLITNVQSPGISEFAIADFIIKDYLQFGLYQKQNDRVVLNEPGEVLWEDTINTLIPVINKRKPIYLDTLNRIGETDPYYYISKVHEWAYYFSVSKYAALLGYTDLQVPHGYVKDLNKLGHVKLISAAINKELRETYLDREVLLLKALDELITRRYISRSKRLSLFGTSSFHGVWEAVCGSALSNEFAKYEGLIPKPIWTIWGKPPTTKRTLRPDIVRTIGSEEIFLLVDAKYYNIGFDDEGLTGNPGVGDVSKQLFYAKALADEIAKYQTFHNLFMFPSSEDIVFDFFGTVQLNCLKEKPVMLVKSSAMRLFDMYIKKQSFSEDDIRKLTMLLEKDDKTEGAE